MYTFEINEKRDEMTILRKGQPVYKAGYHPAIGREPNGQQRHFEDCVRRIETQLIGG